MENKRKHLEFIQDVINRLATNSFQMKGWSVVLVAAILVLLVREEFLDSAYIALPPVLVFWGLDAYFLWRERLYRALYVHVCKVDETCVNFSMNVRDSNTHATITWLEAVRSRTLLFFYMSLVTTVGLASAVC